MCIEEATGLKLVNRDSHSVSLTVAGKTFLEGSEKALSVLEDAHRQANLVDSGIEGIIKIGHKDLVISSDLPKLIGIFNEQYPRIVLDFFMGGTEEILNKLQKKELDIGFVTGPIKRNDLNHQIAFENALVVALWDGHPLEKRAAINLREIAKENFVFRIAKFCKPFMDHVQKFFQKSKITPNVSSNAVSLTGILSLVAEKKGITIIPDCVKNFHRRGIQFHYISDMRDKIPTEAVWSKDMKIPTLEHFHNCMRNVFSTGNNKKDLHYDL